MSTLAACLIVRDEAELLADCLASLKPFVDEVCVLDTGSTDATIDIARTYGARVSSHVWQRDFSAARNASLAMANSDWILVVDADERVVAESALPLRGLLRDTPELAFLVTRLDLRVNADPDEIALARLFRNHAAIKYTRPVHEDVTDSLFALGAGAPQSSGVQLLHLGYLPDVLKRCDKLTRNLAILRQRFVDAPDDLYSAYKLAVSLPLSAAAERATAIAVAMRSVGRFSASELREFPYLPRLFELAARESVAAGHLQHARELCERGLGLFPDAVFLRQFSADILRRCGEYRAARTAFGALEANAVLSEVRAESSYALILRQSLSCLALALDEQSDRLPSASDLPDDLTVYCAWLRLCLQQGQYAQVTQSIGHLLERYFEYDEVKLLGGEYAWASRDFETARIVWSSASQSSEAGHRAHSWLALLQAARSEPLTESGVARDVASAALYSMLARLRGKPAVLDRALVPTAVAAWTQRWARELRHAGRADLAEQVVHSAAG